MATAQFGTLPDAKIQNSSLGLKIKQGSQLIEIEKSEQVITLSRQKFSFLFNLKKDNEEKEQFYAARLVADTDANLFKQFKAGITTNEIPALTPGTGMAGPRSSAYDCIFLDKSAHHYIFYSNEDKKRANRLSEEDGVLKLTFDIENFCLNNSDTSIASLDVDKLYMVFFIDQNLNDVMEEDEFVKIKLRLKK